MRINTFVTDMSGLCLFSVYHLSIESSVIGVRVFVIVKLNSKGVEDDKSDIQ